MCNINVVSNNSTVWLTFGDNGCQIFVWSPSLSNDMTEISIQGNQNHSIAGPRTCHINFCISNQIKLQSLHL